MKGFTLIALFLSSISLAAFGPTNLVENARFDAGIDGWTDDSQTDLAWVSGSDVNGDPNSGSVEVTQVVDAFSSTTAQSNCFDIQSSLYDFGGWFYVDSAESGDPKIVVNLRIFDGPDCTGNLLDSFGTNNFVSTTDAWFLKASTERSVSAGAVSGQLEIRVFNGVSEAISVLSDDIFVTNAIFEDRFEL